MKRKLLVVVGAGASIDFGLPGVAAVGNLLEKACRQRFPLVSDPRRSIYDWIADEIAAHRMRHMKPAFVQRPHFEEMLYAVFQMRTLYPNGHYTSPIGALAEVRSDLPAVDFKWRPPTVFDADGLNELGGVLVDTIVDEFRNACRELEPARTFDVDLIRDFFAQLAASYEIAVVTLNYDDIVWRAAGVRETGFRPDGRFDDVRLLTRATWSCFLHLHGSVHFDMRGSHHDLHDIHWEDNLAATFQQNSAGRSGIYSTEGHVFPQSAIVAGFGKTQQIQRYPFRTYYSELDRLVAQSDALLCLGYGFGDEHLNGALARYHDGRRRKVVLIDWAQDDWMTAGGAADFGEDRSVVTALQKLGNNSKEMSAMGRTAPDTVEELRRAREFELSMNPNQPLAIWYNGMLEACRNAPKVIAQL